MRGIIAKLKICAVGFCRQNCQHCSFEENLKIFIGFQSFCQALCGKRIYVASFWAFCAQIFSYSSRFPFHLSSCAQFANTRQIASQVLLLVYGNQFLFLFCREILKPSLKPLSSSLSFFSSSPFRLRIESSDDRVFVGCAR